MPKSKVDQINDAFIAVLTKRNARKYSDYIKSINKEMIDNIDNLTADKVKSIVKNAKMDVDDLALLFAIQNAVLLIVSRKVRKKDKDNLLPVIALMGMYSLKKPKRFVERISKVVSGVGLNANEQKALGLVKEFESANKQVLVRARRIALERTEIGIIKSKHNKRMIRDFKRFTKEGDSAAKIKNKLVRKYNKLSNVERVLDTELHAQSELVRQEHSKALGYTHKTWKTQEDSRVRDTHFHNGVADKRIPIDSDFRAGGQRAEQPGDVRLQASDRIRCRCYLRYD